MALALIFLNKVFKYKKEKKKENYYILDIF